MRLWKPLSMWTTVHIPDRMTNQSFHISWENLLLAECSLVDVAKDYIDSHEMQSLQVLTFKFVSNSVAVKYIQ